MLPLIRFFIDLCLLRAKPQDLPTSQALFGLVVAVNVVIGGGAAAGALGGPLQGFLGGVLDTAILALYLWLLLGFRNHRERFLQTATAALGVSAMVSAVSLPLQWALPADPEAITAVSEAASLLFLVLVVWLQVALGHVLRHALSVSLLLGVGLSFVYAFVSGILIQTIFLTPTAAP